MIGFTINNPESNPYGYIIRWTGMGSVKLVSQLLQHNIRVRYTTKPFISGGQNFDRGSMIILKTGNHGRADSREGWRRRRMEAASGRTDRGEAFWSEQDNHLP